MNKILQLNDLRIHGAKGNPTTLVNKLNKAVSQSEYGTDFCQTYYGKDYIDGLIDTVENDCKFSKAVINKAKKALKSHSINVKNRYLKSRTNENFDKFVVYDNSQTKDANSDIREDIKNEREVLEQLKPYAPDTVVELSGSYNDCVHPLKYSSIKHLLDYDYLK